MSVNQTSLSNFNFEQLLEKQPLIIHDEVADALDLCRKWFTLSRIRCQFVPYVPEDGWIRSRYRCLFVHAGEKTEVLLAHPHHRLGDDGAPSPDAGSLLGVQLQSHSLLIVPLHWRLFIENPSTVAMLGVHDMLTWLLP